MEKIKFSVTSIQSSCHERGLNSALYALIVRKNECRTCETKLKMFYYTNFESVMNMK